MEQQQQRSSSAAIQVVTIVAATVVILAVFGAVVALSLAGREPGVIAGLVGPTAAAAVGIIAALAKLSKLEQKTDEQTTKIEQVAHQTNGALRDTIRNELNAALDARLGPQPASRTVTTKGRQTR